MLIDRVPDIMRPLQGPLVYLGPRTKDGREGFVFEHPTQPLWVVLTTTRLGATWTICLGHHVWCIPRMQPTPDGFQADLTRVFGVQVFRGLDLLADLVSWCLLPDGHAGDWTLSLSQKHLRVGGDARNGIASLPFELNDLMEAYAPAYVPLIIAASGQIQLKRIEDIQGTLPTTMHARLHLAARIRSEANALGHADVLDLMLPA